MTGPAEATSALAALAAAEVPANAVAVARRRVVEVLAGACLGNLGAGSALRRALAAGFGGSSCSLIGTTTRAALLHAAMVNAWSAAELAGPGCPVEVSVAVPVVAAVVALGEEDDISGALATQAVAAGTEAGLRLLDGLGGRRLRPGWQPAPVFGGIAAAVAASCVLALSPDLVASAIGIAATQAAGLDLGRGTDLAGLPSGRAAADGLEAAVLAASGFSGPHAPVEGRRALGHLMSQQPDYGAVQRPGEAPWRVAESGVSSMFPAAGSEDVRLVAVRLLDGILPAPAARQLADDWWQFSSSPVRQVVRRTVLVGGGPGTRSDR